MSTYTLQYLTHKNTKPMQQQKSKTLIQIIYEIIKHQNHTHLYQPYNNQNPCPHKISPTKQ